MRRIGLCISLLVTVLAMSACESEAQTFADCDQKTVKQTAAKPISNKKKQDFQTLPRDMQLAIVFSSMIHVSEAFDYGIGNPEYFVRSSMTTKDADSAKENLKSIQLENKPLQKQNSEAFALLQKTSNQEMSRSEMQQLKENRAAFFEIAASYDQAHQPSHTEKREKDKIAAGSAEKAIYAIQRRKRQNHEQHCQEAGS